MSGIHFTLVRTPSNHIGTKPIQGILSVQRKNLKKEKMLESSSSAAKIPIQKSKKNSSLSIIVFLLMVAPAFMHSFAACGMRRFKSRF